MTNATATPETIPSVSVESANGIGRRLKSGTVFIGISGHTGSNKPLFHMSDNSQTLNQIKSAPNANTIFHSDLPYVFSENVYELTTYTNWNNARKFTIPTAARTWRTNNPNGAFFIVCTDSNNRKFILDPEMTILQSWGSDFSRDGSLGNAQMMIVCASYSGNDPSFAFGSANSDLTAITRRLGTAINNKNYNQRLNFTQYVDYGFDNWSSGDTFLTILRNPRASNSLHTAPYPYSELATKVWYNQNTYEAGHRYDLYVIGAVIDNGGNNRYGKDFASSGVDITSVQIITLNIENTNTGFASDVDSIADDTIRLSRTEFTVNGKDLTEVGGSIVSKGVANGGTVSAVTTGQLVGAKGVGNLTFSHGKVSANGTHSGSQSPVVEIPDVFNTSNTVNMLYDFGGKVISRNGESLIQSGGFVSGKAYVVINQTGWPATINQHIDTVSLATNQYTVTGSLGNTSGKLILASYKYGNNAWSPLTILRTGDNRFMRQYNNNCSTFRLFNPNIQKTVDQLYVMNISANGTISFKVIMAKIQNQNISGQNAFHRQIRINLMCIG